MKLIFFLTMIFVISVHCNAQKLSDDTLLLHKRIEYDSLRNTLVYSKDYQDSIKIYEFNIFREIDIAIKKLKAAGPDRREERRVLINYLEEYKKTITSVGVLSEVLKTSYGAIPREKGLMSGLFSFKRIKDEYLMLMAILDNAYSNFFLSWEE